jgi:hypothetical protein
VKALLTISVLYFFMLISSCGIYSFTGASLSSDVKTITIHYFENKTSLAPPNIANSITEALKDKFVSESNLTFVNNDGDLYFEGFISDYSIKPVSIQANETAAKNRLTISVKVTFKNRLEETNNYEKTFSQYSDYDSKQDFNNIEESLSEQIVEQIVENIFNQAVANW